MQKYENKQLYMGNQNPSRVTGLPTKSFVGFSQLKFLFLSMAGTSPFACTLSSMSRHHLILAYYTYQEIRSNWTTKCINHSNLLIYHQIMVKYSIRWDRTTGPCGQWFLTGFREVLEINGSRKNSKKYLNFGVLQEESSESSRSHISSISVMVRSTAAVLRIRGDYDLCQLRQALLWERVLLSVVDFADISQFLRCISSKL